MNEHKPRRRLSPTARRDELLSAGEAVLRRLGRDARVEDVAFAAGAAKGTFYVYFASWDNFISELRERLSTELLARFEIQRASYSDWHAFLTDLPRILAGLTSSLEGLHQAVFHPDARPAGGFLHLAERLADPLGEAQSAGAVELRSARIAARLVHALLHEAIEARLEGDSGDEVLAIAGDAIARMLQAKPVALPARPAGV